MSEPPSTLGTATVIETQHHQRQLQYVPVFHGGATTSSTTTAIAIATTSISQQPREYRKGNWTIQETLVLIAAKKLDDERRTKTTTSARTAGDGGELRWKWVENYCWNNGCLRSQNQCNDKWDNLVRDYKKVHENELRSSQSNGSDQSLPSYWAMDKQDRKDRNLPSNLTPQVYEALKDVVQNRWTRRTTSIPTQGQQPPQPPPSPHPPAPPQRAVAPPPSVAETSDSSETDWSGKSDLETRRGKVRDVGSSIIRSASILAQTLKSRETKKAKRHREIMELEERRLRVKEAQNEVNRQGLSDLAVALNNLAGGIHSLISDRTDPANK